MRRIIAIVFASLAAFAIGALAYDVTHPPVAEASGGGGGAAACVQGTGSLVCATSPTLTTPNIGAATGTSLNLGAQTTNGITWSSGTAATVGVSLACSNGAGGNRCIQATGTGTAIPIQATAVNGTAVEAITTGSGAPLYLGGDATSPTRGLIWIEAPQDANPTTAAIGSVTVRGAGVWRYAATAAPIFNAFANGGITTTAAAAGTNQATGTALTAGSDFYTITGANGTTAITLTQGGAGTCIRIMNQVAASALNVFGHNSDNDTINGAAADAVYAQAGGTSLVYCTADGTAWFTY